jgi:signal transduction histidine kinase
VPSLKFSVDAALLRELGERLVGRPHIALSELIKNSYDADATIVLVDFASGINGQLVIADNGHGMTFEAFRDYWMRVGSPHKQSVSHSPKLHRRLTGSKGIGRLAAQFLASRIELVTKDPNSDKELVARLDWREAASSGELTEATVEYELRDPATLFPDGSSHGTILMLSDLQQEWNAEALEQLAREIWPLQPPFGNETTAAEAFQVQLLGAPPDVVTRFDAQMRAILDLWDARLRGHLRFESGQCEVELELLFDDGSRRNVSYGVPECDLHEVDFEIRVFRLAGRQPLGVQVEQGRDYLRRFGGVHVYDSGFHLPYYGPEADWLQIEIDHSHRLSRSRLLPDDLQVQEGLNYLPTNSRLYGVVNVDTALERRSTPPDRQTDTLSIQVSRDRLVDNTAYQALRFMVRWAVDYYAMQEASRELNRVEAKRDSEPVGDKTRRADAILDRYRAEIPPVVYRRVKTEIRGLDRATRASSEILERQTGLLGALATAGISALAIEHEVRKHLHGLEAIAASLDAADEAFSPADVAREIRTWTRRVRDTRRLFAPLMDTDTAAIVDRFGARVVLQEVLRAIKYLTPGVVYEVDQVGSAVLLPPATMAEWFAMLQNVLLNAANATLDSQSRRIVARTEHSATRTSLIVEDTGAGLDLANSDELFQPFIRKLELTPERKYLGLGGSGLGLTIVRIVARNRKVRVRFIEPRDSYAAAFEFSWSDD